jgi:hypothetical protein
VRTNACIASCPTWACGQPNDTTGNSLNCRLNNAYDALDASDTGASPSELAAKCQAAGPNSPICL